MHDIPQQNQQLKHNLTRFHPLETREKQSSVASDLSEPESGNLPSSFIDRSTTSPSKIHLHAELVSHLPHNQSSLAPKTQHPSSLHHHNIKSTRDRDTGSASPLAHIPGKEQSPLPLPHPPPAVSHFAPPPYASEPRSPPNRRPPASRSSYGIETSSGPPPALSTQLSSPTEKNWKHATGVFNRLGSRKRTTESLGASIHGGPTLSSHSMVIDPIKGPPPNEQTPKWTLPIMNTKGMAHDSDNPEDGQGESTLKGSDFPKLPFAISPKSRSGPGHAPSSSQEDLFHKLAHDPAGNETSEGASPKARRSVRSCLIVSCRLESSQSG